MKIAFKEEIYRLEKMCAENYGIPTLVLMENAGNAVLEVLRENIPCLEHKKVLVFCGKGNNGGDGFVVARKLFLANISVKIVRVGDFGEPKEDAVLNLGVIRKLGLPVLQFFQDSELELIKKEIKESDVLIDAIYGIGFRSEVGILTTKLIEAMNDSRKTIVSIDIPSGTYADGGSSDIAVMADLTVVLGILKIGLLDYPAKNFAGKRVLKPIDLPSQLLEDKELNLNLITREDVRALFLPRKRNSYKGNYGHLLVIGGCPGNSAKGDPLFFGAPILAGKAALRSGAGLVTLAVPKELLSTLVKNLPEAMVFPLSFTDLEKSKEGLRSFIEKKKIKSVLIGNGFGTGDFQKGIAQFILEETRIEKLVIDADGLNNLALNKEWLSLKGNKEVILTPHIGEMARLVNQEVSVIQQNKVETARKFSAENNVFIVLKDSVSVIASPNGEVWVNETGSAALAKGGSGDVLAGLIAGLFTSGYSALDASIIGTYALGREGEIYEEKFSSVSALARDILDLIPVVFKEIERL
jgi:NAD(P)H-hydrate epimerase